MALIQKIYIQNLMDIRNTAINVIVLATVVSVNPGLKSYHNCKNANPIYASKVLVINNTNNNLFFEYKV